MTNTKKSFLSAHAGHAIRTGTIADFVSGSTEGVVLKGGLCCDACHAQHADLIQFRPVPDGTLSAIADA